VQEAFAELEEVIADMRKATIDNEASTNNFDEMENLAKEYRAFGIDCEVVAGENGFEISVKNAGGFEGENLLEMSARDVSDLLEEIEEERLAQDKGDDQKGDEKEKSSQEVGSSEEEVTERKLKPMALMPGDVVDEKTSNKAEKKDSPKKEEKKETKKSKLEDVELGERFDLGLGRGSFAGGKGAAKGK